MKINPEVKKDLITYLRQRMKGAAKPVIEISAPYALSQTELSDLKKKIEFLDTAEIKTTVDESILAGIIIRYGSQMIDLSLKNELQKLEQTLYETA
jgi:F0F1-type ATP synthase delta subunit